MAIVATIKYSGVNNYKKIKTIINKQCKELENFWEIKLKIEPILFLLKSRKEINAIRGQKTDNKLVGWFWKEKFLFLLSPEKFNKESAFQKKDFNTILKHELSHLFFLQATGGSLPAWINEGMACYLAGQKYQEKITKSTVEKLINCHYIFDRSLFALSFVVVEKLLNYRGKKILINFLKSFNKNITEKEFGILFKKNFRINFNKNNIYNLLIK
jgi:Predicted Zn-dependent protease (DUF2268).